MPAGHNATRARRMPAWAGLSITAAIVVAFVVYQPHVPRPVDVVDFSEFLPLLEGGSSFLDRLGAMNAYYASHGRFNVLQHAGTVARWSVFGTWTPGWQLTRAFVMLGSVLLAGTLLRRLGASRLGSIAGAACFLFAPAAANSWVRMTMAEATATLLMLALTHRALGFRDRPRWTLDVAIQAAGAATLLLLKEMFLPLLLLPAAAALAQHDGVSWRIRPPTGRRYLGLATAVAASVAIVVVPVVLVFRRMPSTGYASLLGTTWVPADAVAALWSAALVPFRLVPARFSAAWFLALLAWLTIATVGWGTALRDAAMRKVASPGVLFAIGWPLVGILIYTPWPAVASFYGLPYLLGPAGFLAFGLTSVQARAQGGTALAAIMTVLLGLVSITDAHELAGRYQARQVLNDRLIAWVADSADTDSVFVAARFAHRLTMAGPGPTLARHAAATHRPWPPTRDLPCSEPVPSFGPRAVVWVSYECAGPRGSHLLAEPYSFVDWRRWRAGTDSVTARVEVSTGGT